MERVSGAPYQPQTQIETNVRTWVHSRRAPEVALTVSYSQTRTLVVSSIQLISTLCDAGRGEPSTAS
jgi:hypothetical protein